MIILKLTFIVLWWYGV